MRRLFWGAAGIALLLAVVGMGEYLLLCRGARFLPVLLGGGLLCLAGAVGLLAVLLRWQNRDESQARLELDQARAHMQEIQLQKRQEQLNALQNQINPHFLYNTLDTIRGLAIEQGAMDVADIVATLSFMFKYSMDYATFMVPVSEELEHLNSYLKIQSLRFPDKFTFVQQMDCEFRDIHQVQTPKLVLQPLVENIFSHAFQKLQTGGRITLRMVDTDVNFQIIVSDNGTGIEDDRVLALNRMFAGGERAQTTAGANTGIALYNINSRIRMYCGEEYGLHIASTVGYGTEVTVSLPLAVQEGCHEA